MRKFLSVLMAIFICLSCTACGNFSSSKNDAESTSDGHAAAIVGIWKSTTYYMLTFDNDKTGTLLRDNVYEDFTWHYNEDLSCYEIATSAFASAVIAFLKTEDGTDYLVISDNKLYREEDFVDIFNEYIELYQTELAGKYPAEKIKFNSPYDVESLVITFTNLVIENNKMNLYIEVTNNGTETLYNCPVEVGYRHEYLRDTIYGGSAIGIEFSFNQSHIEPGETGIFTANIANSNIIDCVTVFETIVGAATCSFDHTSYYIDLSEYTTK